ncbi:unnamed protein product [Camellia sinensis]
MRERERERERVALVIYPYRTGSVTAAFSVANFSAWNVNGFNDVLYYLTCFLHVNMC